MRITNGGRLAAAVILSAFLFILGACGSDDGDDTADRPTLVDPTDEETDTSGAEPGDDASTDVEAGDIAEDTVADEPMTDDTIVDDPDDTSADDTDTTQSSDEDSEAEVEAEIARCAVVGQLRGLIDFAADGLEPGDVELLLAGFDEAIDSLDDAAAADALQSRADEVRSVMEAAAFDASAAGSVESAAADATDASTSVGEGCGLDLSGPPDGVEETEDSEEPETDLSLAIEEFTEEMGIDRATAECIITELDLAEAGFDETVLAEVTTELCGIIPADFVDQ